MKRLCTLMIPLALAAVPSDGAVYMKSRVHGGDGEQRSAGAVEMVFEGWFDGDRAVIDILESNDAMTGGGKIFIDGDTMTLYDPEENTCAPWDLQALLRFAGAVMESMSGIIQFEFGEPRVQVLDSGSGGTLLGRQVEYLKYQSDWTMSFKAPLVRKRTFDNSTVQEVWFDRRLRDDLPSFGLFFDPDSFSTGYEEMDRAIAAGLPPVEGAVLKSVAVSTTTKQNGNVETSTSVSEVTDLDLSAADPPGGYTAPADCETVSMLPPEGLPPQDDESASESDGDRQFPQIRNPFRRKKKDDG